MNILKISVTEKKTDNFDDVLGFTTEFIVSAWLVVDHQSKYNSYEVLHHEVIDIDNRMNDNQAVNEYLSGDIELNSDHGSRLIYIVHHVKCVYTQDYYGEVDMDYEVEVLAEKKCNSWRHMRAVMGSFKYGRIRSVNQDMESLK